MARLGWLLAGWALLVSPALAEPTLADRFDQYVQSQPEVFSGAVLVTRNGVIVFDKAYGFADAERHVPNQTSTSFHIGSLTRQYIAAAVMMQVEKQRLSLTNTVAQFDPAVPNGDKITVGDLLGSDDPAASDLLAHILETSTARPLADVLDADFFGPLFMTGSGLDDGTQSGERRMAKGDGDNPTEAPPAPSASAFTTTRDELRWMATLFDDRLVSAASRQTLMSGWRPPARSGLGPSAYVMQGQGPGFSSVVVHQQAQDVTVIVLSNRESTPGMMSQVGLYLAALSVAGPGGELPPPVGH
jgi:CubicO group peptidase (beta-lactamase class C family)